MVENVTASELCNLMSIRSRYLENTSLILHKM